jgi:hypothetical protein
VIVHHLRKAESDDVFDTISGSLGLTGVPDSILVLKYDSSGGTVLHGKGRDLIEIEKAITFNHDACTWTIIGEASDVQHSIQRATILGAITEASEPVGARQIAEATGMKQNNVRRMLGRMFNDGAIEKAGFGKYRRRTQTSTQTQAEPENDQPDEPDPADAPLDLSPCQGMGADPPQSHQDNTGPGGPARRPPVAGAPGLELMGATLPGDACTQCGRTDGEIFLIRDPSRGVTSETLHRECAPLFFSQGASVDAAPNTPPAVQPKADDADAQTTPHTVVKKAIPVRRCAQCGNLTLDVPPDKELGVHLHQECRPFWVKSHQPNGETS